LIIVAGALVKELNNGLPLNSEKQVNSNNLTFLTT
jgi:hypothetical protein